MSQSSSAALVSYVLSPALSPKDTRGTTTAATTNDSKGMASTSTNRNDNSAGEDAVIVDKSVVDGAEYLERIRGAQQTTIANLSSASAKITHMTQESDRLLQASMVAFQNHVMTMTRVQADLSALQGRVSQCVGRAERIKAIDEQQSALRSSINKGVGGSSSPGSLPTSPVPPVAVKDVSHEKSVSEASSKGEQDSLLDTAVVEEPVGNVPDADSAVSPKDGN